MKTISSKETSQSIIQHNHGDWDPEWIEGRFSGTLKCTNPACEDHVYACGRTGYVWDLFLDENGDPEQGCRKVYEPRFFEPAPPVFPLAKECPKEVKNEIIRAFSLVWSDHGSCANRLRVAVEAMMDQRGVQRKVKIKKSQNKSGFRTLPLHERIERFANNEKDAATQLMAIKWLGNTGSHASLDELKRNDLLDAFEHFEFALELIYVKHNNALKLRAEQINKKKGPVRRKLKKRK